MYSRCCWLVCALWLAGCATTLNEKQCRSGDWSAFGKIDGANGRRADYWKEHEQTCSRFGAEVDRTAYQAGWAEGVANYCTPESGYYAGTAGEQYLGICAGPAEKAFLAEFHRGHRVALLRHDLQENETELGDLRVRQAAEGPSGNTLLDALGMTPDGMRRRELEDRHLYIAGELTELESAAPATTPLRFEVTHSSMSAGFGALTGTFFGFGLGHAIQGRYAKRGWLFTALETGALAGMVGGGSLCASGGCQNNVAAAGLLLFLSFKVWESIDVWRYYAAASSGYPHLSNNFTPSTPLFAFSVPVSL